MRSWTNDCFCLENAFIKFGTSAKNSRSQIRRSSTVNLLQREVRTPLLLQIHEKENNFSL